MVFRLLTVTLLWYIAQNKTLNFLLRMAVLYVL